MCVYGRGVGGGQISEDNYSKRQKCGMSQTCPDSFFSSFPLSWETEKLAWVTTYSWLDLPLVSLLQQQAGSRASYQCRYGAGSSQDCWMGTGQWNYCSVDSWFWLSPKGNRGLGYMSQSEEISKPDSESSWGQSCHVMGSLHLPVTVIRCLAGVLDR
jgi:hypothetical protein